ncbi:MAG: ABC transporter permease [Deltaproteobacteria bacterium]|nr:MAG: ABC transporter permease [Deltaproteobacteria bacterium]
MEYVAASRAELLAALTRHLVLVGISVGAAVAIGVPAGVVVARRVHASRAALAFANTVQTIPSLALFAFLIPVPIVGGTGVVPAIVALTLYALLPVLKNTITGLRGVDPAVRDAAVAMGMTPRQLLWRVDLPLSLSVILAGIRIATVVTVGTATIAAAIGAGGLGVFIFRGLTIINNHAILTGAIPAALLALLLDALLGLVERALAVRPDVAVAA